MPALKISIPTRKTFDHLATIIMSRLHKFSLLFPLITIFILVSSCGITPDSSPSGVREASTVRELIIDNYSKKAAEQHLYLASQTSLPRSYDHILAATEIYLNAQDPDRAEIVFAKIDPTRWTTQQEAHGYLLAVRIALAKNRPQKNLAFLKKIHSSDCDREGIDVPSALSIVCTPNLPKSLWLDFFKTRALAHAVLGENYAFKAVQDRIALDTLLTEPTEIEANHREIWSLLSSLPDSFLAHAYLWSSGTQTSDLPLRVKTLKGWLTLANIVKQHLSNSISPYSQAFSQTLMSWQKRYPEHPARQFLLKEFITIAQNKPPSHVALLLPLNSVFSGAAKAIRDGFLSAWFQDEKAIRPIITIHDTTGADITTVYTQAIHVGAEFIVGPLGKPSVTILEELPKLSVPTLVLNEREERTENEQDVMPETRFLNTIFSKETETTESFFDSNTPFFYRFTLSPGLEAKQVAKRAWSDGHTRVAILTPQTHWGQRMERAFAKTWEQLGGTIVDSQSFSNDSEEIFTAVQQLLNNSIKYQPPPIPEDAPKQYEIDCILVAAFPQEARQIQPQLKFHEGGDIPIYATSHIFSGTADPLLDEDINGIMFGDMPWVLHSLEGLEGKEANLRNTVNITWPEFTSRYLRYYALGIDAYRVIPHLKGLRNRNFESFMGETGELSVSKKGRINRQLLWARIHKGRPVPDKINKKFNRTRQSR